MIIAADDGLEKDLFKCYIGIVKSIENSFRLVITSFILSYDQVSG